MTVLMTALARPISGLPANFKSLKSSIWKRVKGDFEKYYALAARLIMQGLQCRRGIDEEYLEEIYKEPLPADGKTPILLPPFTPPSGGEFLMTRTNKTIYRRCW
jgi:hypothetical protein